MNVVLTAFFVACFVTAVEALIGRFTTIPINSSPIGLMGAFVGAFIGSMLVSWFKSYRKSRRNDGDYS